jgi:hybrid cluster-associated redox disulfide protein
LLPHNEARSDASRHRSMKNSARTLDMTVDQVMKRWPASVRVFLDFRMGCVGCPIAAFHSVDEASREHEIDGRAFVAALRSVTG